GDGGAGTAARLNQPMAVAIDIQGNLLIADYSNYAIRKVSGGTIATIAGLGRSGFTADGAVATKSAISLPQSVAVDSAGAVYFPDSGRVRTIDSEGALRTVAGGGTSQQASDGTRATAAQTSSGAGLAVSPAGDVLYSDTFTHVVRAVSAADQTFTRVAGRDSWMPVG